MKKIGLITLIILIGGIVGYSQYKRDHESINNDNEQIITLANQNLDTYNQNTFMHYFHTVKSSNFSGKEYYRNNHSIIFDYTNKEIKYQEYKNNDRTNQPTLVLVFTPDSEGIKNNTTGKIINKDDIVNNNYLSSAEYQIFQSLYLQYGNTAETKLTTDKEIEEYATNKLKQDNVKVIENNMANSKNAEIITDFSKYVVYENGSITTEKYNRNNEAAYNRYVDGYQEQQPITCDSLCNEATTIKFLSDELGLEDDSNAGFIVKEAAQGYMVITVYADNLENGDISENYHVNLIDETYKIDESNSGENNLAKITTAEEAINLLKSAEFKNNTDDLNFSLSDWSNNQKQYKILVTSKSMQEQGGSGTVGTYIVTESGDYMLQ